MVVANSYEVVAYQRLQTSENVKLQTISPKSDRGCHGRFPYDVYDDLKSKMLVFWKIYRFNTGGRRLQEVVGQ